MTNRITNKNSSRNKNSQPLDKSSSSGFIENSLCRLFRCHSDEPKANLSIIDWVVYAGILLVILIMPFLFSRTTTENFLTPKEFFSKIAIVLIAGLYCVQIFMRRKIELAKTTLDLPMMLFFSFAALSVIWNYNVPSAIRDIRGVLMVLLLFPLIVNVVRSRWQVELILWAVIFTGIATSTIGIMETYNFYFKFDSVNLISFVRDDVLAKKIDPNGYYLPLFPQLANPNNSMGSVISTFGNRNYLGTFAMFTAFFPLAFFFYYRNWGMKIFSVVLYGWMLYGMYITRCRAALIGIAIGIVYMLLMMFLNYRRLALVRKNLLFFIVAITFIFAGLLVVSVKTIKTDNIFDKIKSTFTLSRNTSNTYERMWVWHATIQSFNKSVKGWLLGNGFGSYKHFFPYQEPKTFSDENQETFTAVTFRQAHNDWLQVISEMGLIGLVLLLFLVYRFFGEIQTALRRNIFGKPGGELNGDNILLISIGAAMVAQLLASVPDFPFHRIETAVYAVVFMALLPVLAETDFFKHQLEKKTIPVGFFTSIVLVLIAFTSAIAGAYYENRYWKADQKVRTADMYMRVTGPQAKQYTEEARRVLYEAILYDKLPGDPYLKLSQIYAQNGNFDTALDYADKSMKNINYNARSTYHSSIFRKMHINYHLKHDLQRAYTLALSGIDLTCGKARSVYYMYAGKIALDLSRYIPSKERREEILSQADEFLNKVLQSPQFTIQAKASLVILNAGRQNWKEALKLAEEVSNTVRDADPTILNILGIAASNLGDNDKAENALLKAIKLVPNNMVFKRDLGTVYVRSNRLDLARPQLEEVILSSASTPDIKTHAEALIASITAVEISSIERHIEAGEKERAATLLFRLSNSRTITSEQQNWTEEMKKMIGYDGLAERLDSVEFQAEKSDTSVQQFLGQ